MAYPTSGRAAKVVYNSGLVGNLHEWSLDVTVDVLETSAFGQQWKTYIDGMAGASGTLRGWYNPDDSYQYQIHQLVVTSEPGAEVILKLYTDGTDYYEVTAILGGVRISVAQAGVISIEIPFNVSGIPTFSKT